MGLIDDLRTDIGDDGSVIYPSGVVSNSELETMLRDIRLDIGDDEDITWINF